MKVVILAGGLGSRLSEETTIKPKPMVEIGGKPILWHIMKIYAAHGLNDFIICCGYKGYVIKEYFANYFLHMSDVTFDIKNNRMEVHQNSAEEWKVTLVDTGETTGTGGRLRRIRSHLGEDEFCFTYGDGVGSVNIKSLISFHKSQSTLVTVTTVQAPVRYGFLSFDRGKVTSFEEKPEGESGWINGGFFVASPKAIDMYVDTDDVMWVREPMKRLVKAGELSAFRHDGFWYAMDTVREKAHLEGLWATGKAPWKVWK